MIFRETVWRTDAGDELQLSFAVADDYWELFYESTYPLGPFHTLHEQRLRAEDDWRRWLLCHGHQGELGIA